MHEDSFILTFRVDSTFFDLCFGISEDRPSLGNKPLEVELDISEGLVCGANKQLPCSSRVMSTRLSEGINIDTGELPKGHKDVSYPKPLERKFKRTFGHPLLWYQLD